MPAVHECLAYTRCVDLADGRVDCSHAPRAGANAMSLRDDEFRVLRETIAVAGHSPHGAAPADTLWLGVARRLVWSSSAKWPIAALLSLGVLVAGFEAIHALHVGVERIGRYIQVFTRRTATGRSGSPRRCGSGRACLAAASIRSSPLVFVAATLANLVVAFIPPPAPCRKGWSVAAARGVHRPGRPRAAGCRPAARRRSRDLHSPSHAAAKVQRPARAGRSRATLSSRPRAALETSASRRFIIADGSTLKRRRCGFRNLTRSNPHSRVSALKCSH